MEKKGNVKVVEPARTYKSILVLTLIVVYGATSHYLFGAFDPLATYGSIFLSIYLTIDIARKIGYKIEFHLDEKKIVFKDLIGSVIVEADNVSKFEYGRLPRWQPLGPILNIYVFSMKGGRKVVKPFILGSTQPLSQLKLAEETIGKNAIYKGKNI